MVEGEKASEKVTGRKQSGREDGRLRDCSPAWHREAERYPSGGLGEPHWCSERGGRPLNMGQGHALLPVTHCFLKFM